MKLLIDMTEPELRVLMTSAAAAVEAVLRQHCGPDRPKFALLVFEDPVATQYVSSCRREHMVTAFREAADRIENRQDVPR